MSNVIPLKDLLFVFESWTLILDVELCAELAIGNEVDLLDESMMKVGHARLIRVLPSRDPDLRAIAISVNNGPNDLRTAKFLVKV